jgi:HAD superfamily hydrolase (TIGR01509 family)
VRLMLGAAAIKPATTNGTSGTLLMSIQCRSVMRSSRASCRMSIPKPATYRDRRRWKKAPVPSSVKTHALLLDFDGVIVDSEGMQLEAVNTVLAPYGVRISPTLWSEHCVGHKAREFLPDLLPALPSVEELDRLLAAKSTAYQQIVLAHTPVARPGIRELVDQARRRRFRCGVASATPAADLDYILRALGWTDVLDLVLSSDAVPRPKPAPDVYLRAAELLGVVPENCVVVEDTPTGIAAARAAGMYCVAFPNRWTTSLDVTLATRIEPVLDTAAIERILDLAER